MRVKSLEIRKRESYDSEYPNEVVGIVDIVGETGRMEVRLFPSTISKIFRLCKDDVRKVAGFNAEQAPTACENIASTIDMQVENEDLKQLEQK